MVPLLLTVLPTLLAAPQPLGMVRGDDYDWDYDHGDDYNHNYDYKTAHHENTSDSYTTTTTTTHEDKWKTSNPPTYSPTLTISSQSPSATESHTPNPVIAPDLLERIIDAPTVVDRLSSLPTRPGIRKTFWF
ncbi:hypothetical protein IAR55_007172 [Kwoniella newhampshirensis]|uniref:Uncharacterized protein n=1 Tax=Kwoniella newhampshirensis TaxID=1651941 RepID=A0AAW0YD84_9TREE